MQALFNSLIFPDKQAIKFAIKGVIAMALSLYIAMFLNLDRPYWALIGAVFLQIRPEGGLVVEKGMYQIIGTLVGGFVGITILQWFAPYPEIALGLLALWLGINSGLSAMVRRQNLVYAFAMAGMTACLVCLLVMIQPEIASSQRVFDIAQARISEIVIGVICATLVSKLIWPVKVKDGLVVNARNVINQTLGYLVIELDKNGTHQERHHTIDSILESVTALSDDSSAVSFEGPEGLGQSRAANAIGNSVLSLLALVQIFGRLQRRHPELVGEVLEPVLDSMRTSFTQMATSRDYDECYAIVQSLRRKQMEYANQVSEKTPLQKRLLKIALELSAELIVLLKGYAKLSSKETTNLNAPSFQSHRDPLVGITTGLRSVLLFLVGAGLWVGTGSSSVMMIMILPVVFSIMMARLPMAILTTVLKRLLVGIVIALPLAIFYALPLVAASSKDFELLVLILAGPYFLGLLALANRATLPYGLGICIPFTTFVMPSTDMTRALTINTTISNGMAIFVGVTVLYWIFKLVTGPSLPLMQSRLMKATQRDLIDMDKHTAPEQWFNARMGDRLLRISTYDKALSSERNVTDLALTGLNFGHVSMRLHRIVRRVADNQLDSSLRFWQEALANAYLSAFHGKEDPRFQLANESLLSRLDEFGFLQEQKDILTGMCERIQLTLERSAQAIAAEKA
ncbi:fusaric acid resistance protein [Vibrio natriegens]|uniref:FUSC family protein n=1 Tax=Vibrio natriegens TaxID=691 RepID=UPI000803F6E3|nr:FUSC family protein [Vibrio natriegens]ANQ21808.1 fusaric acid resistance protein [Vibrio natriegens]